MYSHSAQAFALGAKRLVKPGIRDLPQSSCAVENVQSPVPALAGLISILDARAQKLAQRNPETD